ncbi:MAG: murein biosynthesis integral membrane protein MurJ [Acidimicrobiia bacterium]
MGARPVTTEARRAAGGRGLLGSTAAVTAGNLASRITGFLRVLAVGLALGTTFAGNTYQTANLVSNVLFELLAAGLLSSVLVPPFVRLLDEGRARDAERLAGAVLGVTLAALGGVLVLALLGRPLIMRALTVAVEDPVVRRQEVALGSFLLLFFLPQLVLYAVGAVATGLLHGAQRFAAAAFAPVANNIVVIATMGAFAALHGGRPGLDLATSEKLVLALGTTAGVLAMSVVPVVALRRAGLRLRPAWDPRHPGLRTLARDGAWAAGLLSATQLLLVASLVLANRVEGGVVAFHIAFQVFLLPFALAAHPVSTALYPRLASAAAGRRWAEFRRDLRGGGATLAFLVLPASALMAAVAGPALRVLRLGNLDEAGARLAGSLVAAYAVGLAGYAAFYLLVRASYAAGDTRTPTVVGTAVAAGGAVLTVVLFAAGGDGPGRLAALGWGHSVAYVAGAAALATVLARRTPGRSASSRPGDTPLVPALARSGACALAAGGAAWTVAEGFGGGRGEAVAAVLCATAVGGATYLLLQRALGAPELAWLRGGRP